MGRIHDRSEVKMRGRVRIESDGSVARSSSKRRKTRQENLKATEEPNSPGGGGGERTPTKDRKVWSQEEEVKLVKVLLEHKREGKSIPLQSKTAPYWTDLIPLVYPGEKGVAQRRLYDKARRMLRRYNECFLLKEKTPWRSMHEKALFDFWEKIFVDEMDTNKPVQETKIVKVSNGNSVKVVQASDPSSEEEDDDDDDDDDDEEERVPIAKNTPKAGPPAQVSSGSEEEEEDDEDGNDSSPVKRRSVPAGQKDARVESARAAQEELRKTASLPRDDKQKAASKLGFKQSRGSEKEMITGKERLHDVENGQRRSKGRAEQARLDTDMVRSLEAELFQYVHNLRSDCMRELDEVRSELTNPARLQLARRRQELILEELSLQEKELEISQRYCRLQKDALKLQNAS